MHILISKQNHRTVYFLYKLPLLLHKNATSLKVKVLSFSSFAFFRVLKLEPVVEYISVEWLYGHQAVISFLSCHLLSLSSGDAHLNSDMRTAQFNSLKIYGTFFSVFDYRVRHEGT